MARELGDVQVLEEVEHIMNFTALAYNRSEKVVGKILNTLTDTPCKVDYCAVEFLGLV